MLLEQKSPVYDFQFARHDLSLLASSSRLDGHIRLWDLSTHDSQENVGTRIYKSAHIYLTGHSKRVESLKFHPTYRDILASSSTDGTLRLWSMEHMQPKIRLTCSSLDTPNYPQSFDFNSSGNALVSVNSAATLEWYDPRSSTLPIQSSLTSHISSKPCRASWSHISNNSIVSTGFDKKSVRNVLMWDTRNLQSPVQSLASRTGSGFAHLQPIWDLTLPLLYLTARNDNLQVLELSSGLLKEIAVMQMEKQVSALHMLPKSLCSTPKCEIAKFLRLSYVPFFTV